MKLVIFMVVLTCSLYASHAQRFCLHWGHCPSSKPCCAARGPGSHNICKENIVTTRCNKEIGKVVCKEEVQTICNEEIGCKEEVRTICNEEIGKVVCKEEKGLYSVDGEECILPTLGFNTDRSNWTHTEDPFEPYYDPWWSNVFNIEEQLG